MLTEEQIKNLKAGDIVYLNNYPLTFKEVGDDLNTISAKDDVSICGEGCNCWFTRKYLTLQPKHDPCRLFKSGDIVEMDTHGRDIAASMKRSGVELGKRYTVTEDENNTGYVSFIGDDGIERHSMFFWLKLVAPVEELEPYHILHNRANGCVIYKDELKTDNIVVIFNNTHPNAKSAAEAEAARLNDEYRKEHENEN